MQLLVATVVVTLVAVSCAVPTATPTPTPTPTTVPAEAAAQTSTTSAPLDEAAEMETLRRLAFAYWEAFNSYDADRTLEYLEEGYRQEREAVIRKEIGQIRFFRVKLGMSEESPPRMTGPVEGEMYLKMKEPLGTRRIHMAFRKVGSEWKITYAQEVK